MCLCHEDKNTQSSFLSVKKNRVDTVFYFIIESVFQINVKIFNLVSEFREKPENHLETPHLNHTVTR